MTISITLSKSTGTPQYVEPVTNINFKNDGQPNSVAEYYLYPITIPQQPFFASYAHTNHLSANVTGTYSTLKRPRWAIQVPDLNPAQVKFYAAIRDNYVESDGTLDGTLSYYNDNTINLYPRVSSQYQAEFTSNASFTTNYLVTQILVLPGAQIGNISPIKITFSIDVFE